MLPGERQSLSIFNSHSLLVDETRRVCPVCKAPCSVPSLVPVYVRTEPTPEAKDGVEEFLQDEPANNDEAPQQEALSSPVAQEGLRHRLRFRSRDSEIPNADSNDDTVPARPAANSPTRPAVPNNNTSPSPIPSSVLTHHFARQAVPPLHRREGHGNASLNSLQEADPTEFLSRILLMLGSFVILCLLLF